MGERVARTSASCEKQRSVMDRLKAAIEAERARTTEFMMAMKGGGSVIIRYVIEEPTLDLQMLKALHAIRGSYFPDNSGEKT